MTQAQKVFEAMMRAKGYTDFNKVKDRYEIPALPIGTKLFTHPPQRTWVGLTDEEIIDVIHPLVMADMPDQATDYEIAKAIEAKLKEKNT